MAKTSLQRYIIHISSKQEKAGVIYTLVLALKREEGIPSRYSLSISNYLNTKPPGFKVFPLLPGDQRVPFSHNRKNTILCLNIQRGKLARDENL